MNALTASSFDVVPTAHLASLIDGLQRLGPVLCMYPARFPGVDDIRPPTTAPWPLQRELAAMLAATRTRAEVELGSDGPNERIWFLDHGNRPCFGLWLLPDTDYLAWDGLFAECVERRALDAGTGWCERLRARWLWWLGGGCPWCGGVRRFQLSHCDGRATLALLPVARLSALGSERTARIAAAHALHIDPTEFDIGSQSRQPGTSRP